MVPIPFCPLILRFFFRFSGCSESCTSAPTSFSFHFFGLLFWVFFPLFWPKQLLRMLGGQNVSEGCILRAAAGKPFVLSNLKASNRAGSSMFASTISDVSSIMDAEALCDVLRTSSLNSVSIGSCEGARSHSFSSDVSAMKGPACFNLVFRCLPPHPLLRFLI